jgi:hypothetical protein
MNESYSGAGPLDSTPLPVPYKDRSAGLTVFGVLTILLGCLCGSFLLLIPVSQAMVPKDQQVPFSTLMPSMSVYGILGVALVWLGVDSIMARRWARALLLIFSWSWLVIGLFEMVGMAVIMPKIMATMTPPATAGQPTLPAAAMDGVMVFMFVFLGFAFVLLPGLWTFFYNSRHVKATCDARDPVARWTDHCPLPVLGFSLWMWFAVPMLLLMPLAGHVVAPFFGMFITGLPASLFFLTTGIVWGYAAWLLYRMELRGWWLILIAVGLYFASAILTFARHDFVEMYRLMDFPQAQIDQIQKSGMFEGSSMAWLMIFFCLPFLGYLLFIKRYFRKA